MKASQTWTLFEKKHFLVDFKLCGHHWCSFDFCLRIDRLQRWPEWSCGTWNDDVGGRGIMLHYISVISTTVRRGQ